MEKYKYTGPTMLLGEHDEIELRKGMKVLAEVNINIATIKEIKDSFNKKEFILINSQVFIAAKYLEPVKPDTIHFDPKNDEPNKEPFSTHNFFKELFEDIDKFPFFAEKIPFGSDFRLVPKKQVKDLSKLRDLAYGETDEFYAILNEMADTHAKKNHDYGNSFAELFDECGMTYAYAHMKEKLARVKSLMKSRQKVKEESMEDSLADLANYAVMTLVELHKKKRNQHDSH